MPASAAGQLPHEQLMSPPRPPMATGRLLLPNAVQRLKQPLVPRLPCSLARTVGNHREVDPRVSGSPLTLMIRHAMFAVTYRHFGGTAAREQNARLPSRASRRVTRCS